MSTSISEKVVMDAVRWPLLETDCTSDNKINKNMEKLCKIIINDLERAWIKISYLKR